MGLQPTQDVFAPSIQYLQAADPYQVSSSIHNFQANQVRRILEPHDQNYAASVHATQAFSYDSLRRESYTRPSGLPYGGGCWYLPCNQSKRPKYQGGSDD